MQLLPGQPLLTMFHGLHSKTVLILSRRIRYQIKLDTVWFSVFIKAIHSVISLRQEMLHHRTVKQDFAFFKIRMIPPQRKAAAVRRSQSTRTDISFGSFQYRTSA